MYIHYESVVSTSHHVNMGVVISGEKKTNYYLFTGLWQAVVPKMCFLCVNGSSFILNCNTSKTENSLFNTTNENLRQYSANFIAFELKVNG